MLTVTGNFTNAVPFAVLDPLNKGARVIIKDHLGTSKVDVTLTTGAYGGKGTRGWTSNKRGTKWTFLDTTGSPANGVFKFVIIDKNSKSPNQVRTVVRGKNGNYPLVMGDEPIHATLVLGDDAAQEAEECGQSAFANGQCNFNKTATKLICKP